MLWGYTSARKESTLYLWTFRFLKVMKHAWILTGHIIGSFKIGEQQYSLCYCVRLHSIIFLFAGYCDTPSKNNCTANSLCQDDVNNGFKCSCLANYQEQNNVCTRKYKLYLDLGLFFFVLRFFYFFLLPVTISLLDYYCPV